MADISTTITLAAYSRHVSYRYTYDAGVVFSSGTRERLARAINSTAVQYSTGPALGPESRDTWYHRV